jgi:hypothetical protein
VKATNLGFPVSVGIVHASRLSDSAQPTPTTDSKPRTNLGERNRKSQALEK